MLVPYFKASWDNTQVLRTNDQDKSSETPFFIKPKNSAFQVNSIVNTLIWAVGDGKDGVNVRPRIHRQNPERCTSNAQISADGQAAGAVER